MMMNDRTRQLIDAAHQFAYDTIEEDQDFGDLMFRRLVGSVVNECINVILSDRGHLPEDRDDWTEEDHGYYMASSSAINMIKHRFKCK